MTETICRPCGSEQLDVTKICDFCNQALYLTCNNCGYISDEKVHVDCRDAEFYLLRN
jgi:predicted amidophosphoribosyltransferase